MARACNDRRVEVPSNNASRPLPSRGTRFGLHRYSPFLLLLTIAVVTVVSSAGYGQDFRMVYSCDSAGSPIQCPTGITLSGSTLYGTACFDAVFSISTDGSNLDILHTFSTPNDGMNPQAGVILDGATLYGTTGNCGTYQGGTAFKVDANGGGFSVLHQFGNGNDGAHPMLGSALATDGSTLYGVTDSRGNLGSMAGGTIYKINSDGSGYSQMHLFETGPNGWDSEYPAHGLVLSGSMLYGTCASSILGQRIYKINTDGTGFSTVHTFSSDEGISPSHIIIDGSKIYGVTAQGNPSSHGNIFSMNIDGSGYQILHQLAGGSEGAFPEAHAGLTLVGSTLYGTTQCQGDADCGVLFQIKTDGTGFEILHSFTSEDGGRPYGDLVSDGSTLYGVTYGDGLDAHGAIFAVTIPEPSTVSLLLAATIVGLLLRRRWY
jgi:uncharacterized repeat protein (TIGR03803 family)